MQLRPAYPHDTVTGGCFITRGYEIAEGDQIIDLDIDLDSLPAWGRLCVSPQAVRLMVTLLGWELRDETTNSRSAREIDALRDEADRLREVLRGIGMAAEVWT